MFASVCRSRLCRALAAAAPAAPGLLMLRNLARWCYRRRRTVLAVWLLALMGCVFLGKSVGGKYSQSLRLPGTESQKAADLLEADFPSRAGDSGQIVVSAPDVRANKVRTDVTELLDQVARVPGVTDVVSPYSSAGARQIAEGGSVAYATVDFTDGIEDIPSATTDRVLALAEHARSLGLRVELGGQMFEENKPPGGTAAIGLLAAVVILLLTFGSVLAMGLPIMIALFGIGTGLSLVVVTSHILSTPEFTNELASMIGIGVGIDYALFIVTRYRQALHDGLEPERGGRARDRHRGPGGAVRRSHGDDLALRTVPDGRRVRAGPRRRRVADGRVGDGGVGHAAPRGARLLRSRDRPVQRAGPPAPRERAPRQPLVPLEPGRAAPAVDGGDRRARDARRARDPAVRHAPRLQRRREQPEVDDDPQGLRPPRDGVRRGLQRPAGPRGGAVAPGRHRRVVEARRRHRRGSRRRSRQPAVCQPVGLGGGDPGGSPIRAAESGDGLAHPQPAQERDPRGHGRLVDEGVRGRLHGCRASTSRTGSRLASCCSSARCCS